MKSLIRNAEVFFDGIFVRKDVLIEDGIIADIKSDIPPVSGVLVFDMNNCFVFPGLIDVHVHLREPGFFYKETIKSGSLAAAHGGFTTVCAMPNLNPVPDSLENLNAELEIINRDAVIHVLPYGSITVGEKQQELSDMEALTSHVVAFSDDGVGVESADMMEEAMNRAKKLGKMIVAHCEVKELVNGGCVHDGEYAKTHGLRGNPSDSEWREVERDLELVRKTGCDFHVCHVSTKESVELIRKAKAEGLPVTCETAPHYLVLCDKNLQDEGRFKMNPPLRGQEDRDALIAGIFDGTIDMIATDHAPHSAEEKSGGLVTSLNGIVGLETAFAILYTKLVKQGVITLEKLIELMQVNPAQRFGIGNCLKISSPADITVFDLNAEYIIDSNSFLSKGRSTPFEREKVFGKCLLTMVGGVPVWEEVGINQKIED
ncbi:MAG: dihydroorotase [Firmicutes bacterium HGW-Firmicutes-16]|nr:MAG: dihydroorotase [Firmicutes bacterium HGW-Firmicutes-16]